jgi:membrane protein implicated in regulation of membrane protease activity
VSVLLVSKAPPPPARPVKLAGGFTGGLAAGWHALRQVTSWLLTGIGVALPFAAFVILAVYAGLRGRRWLARRRAGPRPAG